MHERSTYLHPWVLVEGEAANLVAELQREVTQDHPLYGLKVRAIARRCDSDDVLFALEGIEVAEVHLTWTGRPEVDSTWPTVRLFHTFSEWLRDGMMPDHYETWDGK